MYGAAGAADRSRAEAAAAVEAASRAIASGVSASPRESGVPGGGASGAVSRLVVFADACGSGSMGLETKKRMREAMYAAFEEAFAAVGVVRGLHQEDRGDGILAALPADVPPALMVGRWLSTLYENLREHNHGRSDRVRVRVGMHLGPVLDDGRGLVGRAVDLTCRLCDSDSAKRIMAAAQGSELMIVVSDSLYTEVVAEGGRHIEPRQYRSGRVRSKETDETAWFHVPGLAEPPMDAVTGARGPTAAQQAAEPGRDDGPQKGGGPSSPGRGVPQTQLDGLTQEFNVEGDNLTVTGSTIHGGFTGFRKEYGAPRERRRDRGSEERPQRERQPEGDRRPAPEREPEGEGEPAPQRQPEGELQPRPLWERDDVPRRGTRPGLPQEPQAGPEGERDGGPWHGSRPGLPRGARPESEWERGDELWHGARPGLLPGSRAESEGEWGEVPWRGAGPGAARGPRAGSEREPDEEPWRGMRPGLPPGSRVESEGEWLPRPEWERDDEPGRGARPVLPPGLPRGPQAQIAGEREQSRGRGAGPGQRAYRLGEPDMEQGAESVARYEQEQGRGSEGGSERGSERGGDAGRGGSGGAV